MGFYYRVKGSKDTGLEIFVTSMQLRIWAWDVWYLHPFLVYNSASPISYQIEETRLKGNYPPASNMDPTHGGPYQEDGSLNRGPNPLPC